MEVSKKIVFIKDWILNYVNSMPNRAESLVIGISGGIDSSLITALANEINPKIDIKSENYKKYIARAESEYIKTIYQSYDNYINKNYKIEIKNAVLKRMENSF